MPAATALRRPRFPRAGAFALTALLGLGGIPAAAHAQQTAPKVALRTTDGRAFSLESARGEVVVLDFWASWCVPCRTSVPFFNSLQDRYKERGIRVLGLTLEENDDAVNNFMADAAPRFTIVRDPSGAAGEAFDVVAMPTTLLIDPDGRIVGRFEGGDKKAHGAIDAAVAALVAGQPLSPGSDRRIAKSLQARSGLKAWERGYLADPIMDLNGDPITRLLREHIHASKEGAAGDGGPAGGGCGCN